MGTVILIPAYGRVYKSWKAAKADWDAGKDFKIEGGPYCSIRDKEQLNAEFGNIVIKYGTHNEKWRYV